MTESDYLSCTDHARLIMWLKETGKVSRRKFQLFLLACCRLVWHLLDPDARAAVEAMEAATDDPTRLHELTSIIRRGNQQTERHWAEAGLGMSESEKLGFRARWCAGDVVTIVSDGLTGGYRGGQNIVKSVSRALVFSEGVDADQGSLVGNNRGADVLRSVVHYPFSEYITGMRNWMDLEGKTFLFTNPRFASCLTPDVIDMCKAAYEDTAGKKCRRCKDGYLLRKGDYLSFPPVGTRTLIHEDVVCDACHGERVTDVGLMCPDRLKIIADALEEAGMPTEVKCCGKTGCPLCAGKKIFPNPIIAHLRSGRHFKGDWAIDLILEKR